MIDQRARPVPEGQFGGKTVHGMPALINGVVARLTLRATLSRRRALLLALPAIILIGISALLHHTAAGNQQWPPTILGTFGFTVIVPLTALIIGTSALSAEVEDGSIVHLLATPVRRSSIIISKWAVATMLTIALAAVPEYLAAAIAKGAGSKLALGLLVGAVAAAFMYNALFIMLSAAFSPGRALAFGLSYIVLWEAVLSNIVPGVALLSLGHYGLAIANSIAHDNALNAYLSAGTGIGMGIAATVVTLVVAVQRITGFVLKGDVA
jgi:ABC-2 type transport system permease protein